MSGEENSVISLTLLLIVVGLTLFTGLIILDAVAQAGYKTSNDQFSPVSDKYVSLTHSNIVRFTENVKNGFGNVVDRGTAYAMRYSDGEIKAVPRPVNETEDEGNVSIGPGVQFAANSSNFTVSFNSTRNFTDVSTGESYVLFNSTYDSLSKLNFSNTSSGDFWVTIDNASWTVNVELNSFYKQPGYVEWRSNVTNATSTDSSAVETVYLVKNLSSGEEYQYLVNSSPVTVVQSNGSGFKKLSYGKFLGNETHVFSLREPGYLNPGVEAVASYKYVEPTFNKIINNVNSAFVLISIALIVVAAVFILIALTKKLIDTNRGGRHR